MMIDPIDDVEEAAKNLDPTKIGLSVQPRFLDREIVITISATDDATFNALAAVATLLEDAYKQEMQHLHSKP